MKPSKKQRNDMKLEGKSMMKEMKAPKKEKSVKKKKGPSIYSKAY